jgi:DNA-binding winged helix-turn-helix (wHTH) protein
VAEAKTQPHLRAGELRRAGVKLKLSGQPFQILSILLDHAGEVVTREGLREQLWPDTFVDFDHNLNKAINKIREVLRDSAESPRFVETLPRRGYRFIAPVESGGPASKKLAEEAPRKPPPKASLKPLHYGLMVFGVALIAVAGLALWKTAFRTQGAPVVQRFIKLTNDGQPKFGTMATDGSPRIYFTELLPSGNVVVQVSVKGGDTAPLTVPLKWPWVLDLSRDGSDLLLANDEVIALQYQTHSLWVQPVAGGSPRRVGTVLAGSTGWGASAAFGADGASVIYAERHDVYSAALDGSSPHKVLTTEGGASSGPFAFRFSPDARALRFSQYDAETDITTIMEAAANGGRSHPMFRGCCGEWTPNGRFFIFQNTRDGKSNLWTLPEKRAL